MNKIEEDLRSAIEALEMASEDAKEWATQYVTSDNAPITVRQYVADKAEPALNRLKSALSYIEKCEPVGELILDPVFLPALKAPLVNWKINLVDLEVGTKFYTSPQPIDKCEPVAYMYQHEETGNIGFIDQWQVDNGFEKNNPRLKIITSLYTSPQPIEKCEPVALVALNNAALQKRVEVLEDLLTSAASIASRNGEGTHWERFIGQLKVNGIGNITAKTFRVLPSDEGYTSPQPREWVVPSNEVIDTLWHKATHESVAHSEPFTRYRFSELLIKQLNTKG